MFLKCLRFLGAGFFALGLMACDGYMYVGHGSFYYPWWYYRSAIIHPVVIWGQGEDPSSPCSAESSIANKAEVCHNGQLKKSVATTGEEGLYFEQGDFTARLRVSKKALYFESTDARGELKVLKFKLKQFEKVEGSRGLVGAKVVAGQTLWLAADRSDLPFDVRATFPQNLKHLRLEFLDQHTGQLWGSFEGLKK